MVGLFAREDEKVISVGSDITESCAFFSDPLIYENKLSRVGTHAAILNSQTGGGEGQGGTSISSVFQEKYVLLNHEGDVFSRNTVNFFLHRRS